MLILSRADKIKRTAYCGVFLALSVVAAVLESLVPVQQLIPLPGLKLGLANIVILYMLFYMATAEALAVSVCRSFIVSLLFGSVTSLVFSLSGGLLSFFTAYIIKKHGMKHFSFFGVCVLCAGAHNTGQICAACVMLSSTAPLAYLPLLLLASVACGLLTGLILSLLPRADILSRGEI